MLPLEAGMPEPVARLSEAGSAPPPYRTALFEADRPGALMPPPALSAGPDARALLRALRRRWPVALCLGLLAAAAAGAAVWFLLPSSYTVFAQLHIASAQPSIMGDGKEARGEALTYQKTQMDLIRSRYVLLAALKRDEVKRLGILRRQPLDQQISWLEEELKVQSAEGSELVTVLMMGSDPTELVPLVNAITQVYMDQVVNDEKKRRAGRVGKLEEVYNRLTEDLRRKRVELYQLADELNTSDKETLTQKQLLLLTTFGELRKQHAQVRFDLMRAKNRLESHKTQEKLPDQLPVPEADLKAALDADPVVRQHLDRIGKCDEIITHYMENATRGLREATAQAALARKRELQKMVDTRREELSGDLMKRFRQKARAEYDMVLLQLQNEVGPLERQETELGKEVDKLAQDVEKIGKRSIQMETLRADIQQDEKTATRVGDELEHLKVELNSPVRVSLYGQEPGVQRKDGKKRLLLLIAAPLAAFLGVCLAIAWWDFRGRRIHTPDEVFTGLGLRVVGAVPALPRNAPVPLLAGPEEGDGSEHRLLESIDGIRTLLLRDASVEATRVIMVTSAVSGEGKTTLATHLAGSLARAGRRTLLIDCDLRRPSIHQLFELPQQPGLSEVLLGEIHPAEATLATPVNGLWVMPAGQWDRNVMQALAKDGVQGIFEKLKGEYDFILVDSHPVLPATDSLLIGQHVDAVLFALLRSVSQTPKVYAACQRLTSLGVRVLGAVVNGTHEDVYGGGYQYTSQPQQA